MRPFSDRKRTMTTAARLMSLTREAAAGLVANEQRRVGSRMTAYENVASAVGRSASWVRKFIRGDEGASPDLFVGVAILTAYRRLNEIVEAAQAGERAERMELQRQIDEIAQSALGLVERVAETSAGGAHAEELAAVAGASPAILTDARLRCSTCGRPGRAFVCIGGGMYHVDGCEPMGSV